MTVPYIFASMSAAQGISLQLLDDDFAYLDGLITERAASIAALRELTFTENTVVYVISRDAGTGLGGGLFRSVTGAAGTYTDDGAITIVPTGGNGSQAWVRIYDGEIQPEWWGATGEDPTIDTPAFQAMVATLNAGNEPDNPSILLSLPAYYLNDQIAPPLNARYYTIKGKSGSRSTVIHSSVASGAIFYLRNARGVEFSGFEILVDSGSPDYAIQINKVAGNVGGAPMLCKFTNLTIDGAGTGIGWTCDSGQDANNEQGLVRDCEFYNCGVGVAAEHSNSLWHRIENNSFEGNGVDISNVASGSTSYTGDGGQFSTCGNRSTLNTTSTYYLGPAAKTVSVVDHKTESCAKFLTTSNRAGILGVSCVSVDIAAGDELTVDADANVDLYLSFTDLRCYTALGTQFSLPNANSKLFILGAVDLQISQISCAGEVFYNPLWNAAGTPTFAGGGTAYNVTAAYNNTVVSTSVSGNAIAGVLPSTKLVKIPGGGGGTVNSISGSFVQGQSIIVYAFDATPAVVFTSANFTLKGGVNASLPIDGTITLCYIDGIWVETARNF